MKKLARSVLALVCGGSTAWGAPVSSRPDARLPIVLAANGCGPGFFRTIDGECVPNRRVRLGPGRAVVLPPPCPRGYRRDPDPGRPICYPVF